MNMLHFCEPPSVFGIVFLEAMALQMQQFEHRLQQSLELLGAGSSQVTSQELKLRRVRLLLAAEKTPQLAHDVQHAHFLRLFGCFEASPVRR